MSKVLNFPSDEYGDATITIKHSKEFDYALIIFCDYIEGLNLENEKSHHLIELAMKQVAQASQDAYLQGFELGLRIAEEPDYSL